MEYGERIAVLRKSRGMTQAELGNELNVTFQAVSKWERGESYPDFGTMSKIAKLFGVPITYFEDGIIPGQNETAAAAAAEPAPAPAPAAEPAPLLLGICSVCGKGVYNEDEIAQKEPKLVCTDCRRKQTERAKNAQLADVKKGKFWRNVGLIVSGAICFALLIYSIYSMVTKPQDALITAGSYCILAIFLFPYIAQLFWRGIVVDITLCGGKIIGGPGVIFTLDIDGITFLIVFKLFWLVIKILFFILSILFFVVIAMIVSPFTFIPAILKLNKGDIDF